LAWDGIVACKSWAWRPGNEASLEYMGTELSLAKAGPAWRRLLQATKAGRGGPGTRLAWTTRKEYYLLILVTLLIALTYNQSINQ